MERGVTELFCTNSLSQESFNAPLDEGKSQYSIDRGTIARVVSQTQVNESLQVLAVTRGDGWVCTPDNLDKQILHIARLKSMFQSGELI